MKSDQVLCMCACECVCVIYKQYKATQKNPIETKRNPFNTLYAGFTALWL